LHSDHGNDKSNHGPEIGKILDKLITFFPVHIFSNLIQGINLPKVSVYKGKSLCCNSTHSGSDFNKLSLNITYFFFQTTSFEIQFEDIKKFDKESRVFLNSI
jgi:hypothetical protein